MRRSSVGFGFVAVLCCSSGGVRGPGKSQWQWRSNAFHPPVTSKRPLRYRQRNRGTSFQRQSIHVRQQSSPEDGASFTELGMQPSSVIQANPLLPMSYQSALCIIPPDECWDTLQRARHFAGDETYHRWPPAIRLLYPFVPRDMSCEIALQVLAKVVERHQMEPFSITLNRWTVMPIPESMRTQHTQAATAAADLAATNDVEMVSEADDDSPIQEDPHYEEIQELISSEEIKGRERKKQRDLRRRKKAILKELQEQQPNNTMTMTDEALEQAVAALLSASEAQQEDVEESPQQVQQQRQQPLVDEFNGPAIIALEPDERSGRRLAKLRELLRRELFADPSTLMDAPHASTTENLEELEEGEDPFRPLIPMGTFPTIDAALQTARRLKGLWDPLSFDVTELHCISQAQRRLTTTTELSNHHQRRRKHLERELSSTPFGCDAMVMLMGEELEMDRESDQLLANHVWEEGTPGGFFQQQEEGGQSDHDDSSLLQEDEAVDDDDDYALDTIDSQQEYIDSYERKLDINDGMFEELMNWLDGDEDEEDMEELIGTSVVIGRTHLFTGERRIYSGMPAASTSEESEAAFILGGGGLGSSDGFEQSLWDETDFKLQYGRGSKQSL